MIVTQARPDGLTIHDLRVRELFNSAPFSKLVKGLKGRSRFQRDGWKSCHVGSDKGFAKII
jgi:hypothetical protein